MPRIPPVWYNCGMKRANWWFLGFTAFFAVAVCCVFWGTWSPSVTFIQPDQATYYPADFLLRKWRDFCAGGAIVPGDLRFLLGGPYVWQELQYALAAYLAALGVAYYLKGRGICPLARYGAAAAYGLMGYNFTLFSAGHLGWFVYLMYGPFCFGLIDRCVRKGKWINWAILGGVLAWSSAQQPDLWLMFTAMAFAYGVFKLVAKLRSTAHGGRAGALVRVLAGVAVTAAVLVAAGWPQLHRAIFVETANREKQISASSQPAADGGEKTTAAVKAERERRYVFCTNWSLPPNEALEFFIPDVNGGSSDPRVSPRNPYRGRIGMQVAPGHWRPYRQHSLYMGFITMCLAMLGIALGLGKSKGDCACANGAANRAEVAFWSVMAAVLLLCAFGAFTPFYRVVFALPVGDSIRCPVKFVHLIEWCVAVLAGFGVSRILGSRLGRMAPRAATAAAAVLLAANAIHLASVDSRYCAVDPADTLRIAVARATGSGSICLAFDAGAQIADAEYVLAGGTAFRDNADLKKALDEGRYAPESFWNFRGGLFVKVPRERAGFALLRKTARSDSGIDGPFTPGPLSLVSLASTLGVCALCVYKAAGRRRRKQ